MSNRRYLLVEVRVGQINREPTEGDLQAFKVVRNRIGSTKSSAHGLAEVGQIIELGEGGVKLRYPYRQQYDDVVFGGDETST